MLMQIPVLLGATLITRFIIYEFIFNMYIPGYLLLRYAALAFLLQIIAVCISGCFINLALKKKDMASLLAKE
jgi:ABC-type antimicrobial peptide transport system permease subunit